MSAQRTFSTSRCRLCWKEVSDEVLLPITTPWSSIDTQSIKVKLLLCIPSLSIDDNSKTCQSCLKELRATYRFIIRCLETESMLSIREGGSNILESVLTKSITEGQKIQVIFEDPNATRQSNVDTEGWSNDFDNEDDMHQDDASSTEGQGTTKIIVSHSNSDQEMVKKEKTSELPLPLELTGALDFLPHRLSFIPAPMEMSATLYKTMIDKGISVVDMSSNSFKKRVIYLVREFKPTNEECTICHAKVTSMCDADDHERLHRLNRVIAPDGKAYPCARCIQKFSNPEALMIHQSISHGIRERRHCKKCNRKFSSMVRLYEHERTFENSDRCVYKCHKCSKEFLRKATLDVHLRLTADAPSCHYLKCKVCGEKFTKEGFKEHRKIHHSFLCSDCGKSFASSNSLYLHTCYVHKGTKSMCHLCGKILKSKEGLKNHIQNSHRKTERIFQCDKCPNIYKARSRLLWHITQRHSDKPVEKVHCTICQKACGTKAQLKAHIRLIHEDPKGHECKICGTKFSRGDYLRRHLNRHEIYSQYKCDICKMSFSSESRLKSHMQVGHDENGKPMSYRRTGGPKCPTKNKWNKNYAQFCSQKPCVCKICHKVMANIKCLQIHYKSHLRIREKKCEKCGFILANASAYSKHIKLHDDPDFEMRCNICYATKSSQLELEEHIRTVHKNLKYECKYCGKKFGRRHLLYSHESLEHSETIDKRNEAFQIVSKKPVYVPDGIQVALPKSRKGIKLPNYHDTDLDELITQIEQGETGNLDISQVRFEVDESGALHNLSEDYELLEQEQACGVLVEEIMNYEDKISL